MWIIFLLLGLFLASVLLQPKDPHPWVYRNPFDRTCPVCGRHEVEECWGEDWERHGFGARGWWEVYKEGDLTKHS